MFDIYGKVDRFFHITERGSDIPTEIKGGIVTFLSMAYILTTNPRIFLGVDGASLNALFTATALAAVFSCLLMGFYAKFPVALAPGMGVNAFLSYTVCSAMGFKYPEALLAVFFSGVLFFALTVTGARAKLMESFPEVLRYSFTIGIGFFIAILGLYKADIIRHIESAPMKLGDLSSTTALLGIFSIVITLVLWLRNKWGAILWGIIITTAVGMIIGDIKPPPGVMESPNISLVGNVFGVLFSFPNDKVVSFVAVVITLAIMDMFDTTGTILAVVERTKGKGKMELDFTNKAMVVDSVATVAGSVFGTSTTTSFIESCTGIESGARTGLMAVVTGIMFFIAMFLAPWFKVVTESCLVGALVFVGMLMLTAVGNIEWEDSLNAATAFITILMIGLIGSITNGIAMGTLIYIIGMIAKGKFKEINKVTWVLGLVFLVYFVIQFGYIEHL